MLELPGQPALSKFRIAKLIRSLKSADKRVESLQARYVYFVATNKNLSREERSRLDALLLSGEQPAKLRQGSRNLYVVPRPGTISPWSSKATDIAKACDIDAVDRIERGICYAVKFSEKVEDGAERGLTPLLYDRMTEAVFGDAAGVKRCLQRMYRRR